MRGCRGVTRWLRCRLGLDELAASLLRFRTAWKSAWRLWKPSSPQRRGATKWRRCRRDWRSWQLRGAADDLVERLATLEAAGARHRGARRLLPCSRVWTSWRRPCRRLSTTWRRGWRPSRPRARGTVAGGGHCVAGASAGARGLGLGRRRIGRAAGALEARDQGAPWRDDVAALQEQLADLATSRSVTYGLVERVGRWRPLPPQRPGGRR